MLVIKPRRHQGGAMPKTFGWSFNHTLHRPTRTLRELPKVVVNALMMKTQVAPSMNGRMRKRRSSPRSVDCGRQRLSLFISWGEANMHTFGGRKRIYLSWIELRTRAVYDISLQIRIGIELSFFRQRFFCTTPPSPLCLIEENASCSTVDRTD